MFYNKVIILLITVSYVYTKNNDPRFDIRIQQDIIDAHNAYRAMVQPTASNMLALKWSDAAATMAQNTVNSCIFGKSAEYTRQSNDFGMCGESIALFSANNRDSNWCNAIKLWNDEKKDFKYGGDLSYTNMIKVENYISQVWATTSHVGCAFKSCQDQIQPHPFHLYVCVYCPIANHYQKLPYKSGPPCADCPNNCENNLCVNKDTEEGGDTNTNVNDNIEVKPYPPNKPNRPDQPNRPDIQNLPDQPNRPNKPSPKKQNWFFRIVKRLFTLIKSVLSFIF